jgi:hypothetical protein
VKPLHADNLKGEAVRWVLPYGRTMSRTTASGTSSFNSFRAGSDPLLDRADL